MPTPFADLFRNNPQDLGRVTNRIHKIIAKSFEDQGGRATMDEVRRRFAICEKWFRDLRGQKEWTVSRVLDNLGAALRAELNGQHWEPDARTIWVPQDGA